MAHSLEVRVPFLDHHLVEHAATIPDQLKVRRGETKWLLKHAARGVVPDRVIERKKVGFFNAAVAGWFRSQLDGVVADYLLDPAPRYAEFLDRDVVRRAVVDHRDRRSDRQHLLLSILMLEVWLSDYLPRATAAANMESVRA